MTERIDLDELRGEWLEPVVLSPDELRALVEAVEAAIEVLPVFECRCHEAYTRRGLHAPECLNVDGGDLRAALARFGDNT